MHCLGELGVTEQILLLPLIGKSVIPTVELLVITDAICKKCYRVEKKWYVIAR